MLGVTAAAALCTAHGCRAAIVGGRVGCCWQLVCRCCFGAAAAVLCTAQKGQRAARCSGAALVGGCVTHLVSCCWQLDYGLCVCSVTAAAALCTAQGKRGCRVLRGSACGQAFRRLCIAALVSELLLSAANVGWGWSKLTSCCCSQWLLFRHSWARLWPAAKNNRLDDMHCKTAYRLQHNTGLGTRVYLLCKIPMLLNCVETCSGGGVNLSSLCVLRVYACTGRQRSALCA